MGLRGVKMMARRVLVSMICLVMVASTNLMQIMPHAEAAEESNVFLLPGVKATASGYAAAEPPSQAIDGDSSSKWSYETGATPPSADNPYWLKIDTGSIATVSRFEIKHAGAGGEQDELNTNAYTIEVSDDDENWEQVVTVTGNVYEETLHSLSEPVSARYFKLNITAPDNSMDDHYAANIYEFQAYGYMEEAAAIPVTGISLNPSAVHLMEGETEQLTAVITPDDASLPAYTWSSSDTNVASVSETGLVTGVGAGTADITVTSDDGGFQASATVTVEGAIQALAESVLIARNSQWSYLDDGSDQGTEWRAVDYDDSSWATAAAPLGYASSGKGLDLNTWIEYGDDSNNKYITTYYRKEFQVADPAAIKQLMGTLIRDDGAVIYLNGQEVYRTNMPDGTITYSILATSAVGDERDEYSFAIDPGLLTDGTNVITAEVHQNAGTSSDTFFSLELSASDEEVVVPDKDQGLLAEYYTNNGGDFAFGDYKATRIDSQIHFTDLEGTLGTWTGQNDNANIRWTGQIVPEYSEDYIFSMIGDNGFRLTIDGQTVIDHWQNDWDVEYSSDPITLEAGRKYPVEIEYFEDYGGSNLYLRWESPSVAKEIVPAEAFYLPADYDGPVFGTITVDGKHAELTFRNELDVVPAGLVEHFGVTAGEGTRTVNAAEVSAENASVLKLELNEPVLSSQLVNIQYDGNGGLAALGQDSIEAFSFSLDNKSEHMDYSPMTIAMSFNGDPKTEMGFAWYTNYGSPETAPDGILDSLVEVTPAGEDFTSSNVKSFSGTSEVVNVKISNSVNGTFISHKALAEGLTPGTTYDYRVGSAGIWSEVGQFTTEAENTKDVTFLYMTDSQGANTTDYEVWADTLNQGLNQFPDSEFLMMPGDLVDAGALEEQWFDYFGQPQDLLMRLPLMATIGNHEGPNNNNFAYHFNLPDISETGNKPKGTVYSFDYGPAHIMVLNTGDIPWDKAQEESFEKQIEWLRREVAQTDKKWKIVAFHKAIYSVGGHSLDSDILELREKLYPVLDELGIDLVLQGHDHTYMRSYQMLDDKPVTNLETDGEGNVLNPDGTLYLINNAAGRKFYDIKPDDQLDKYYASIYQQPYKAIYSGIRITENELTIESFVSGEDEPFDVYSIKRTDSIPEPVENLQASKNGNGEIILTWNRPASEGSPKDPVRGYRIYEKNGLLGTNWSKYIPVKEDQSLYEFTIEESTEDMPYIFVVKAVDERDNALPVEVSTDTSVTAAPTFPVVDDGYNTFGWTNVPGYSDPADYEYSVDGGNVWKDVTANPQPVGDGEYAAGAVMVRVKANEAGGMAAGLPLASDKPFSANSVHNTYSLTGTLTRERGLKVEVEVEQLAEYSGEAYVVFELMNGATPLLINAIPVAQSKLPISQYFNVSGADYRVKVFVFDEFNSDLDIPVHLAEPIEFK